MTTPTASRFDVLTLWLHWLTATLVLAQFATAWSVDRVDPAQVDLVLAVHRSTGVLLWTLTVGRLAWRLTFMRLPPPAPTMPQLQRLAVRANEYALYLLLLLQPITGMVDSLFRAHPFPLFGLAVPVLVAKSKPIYHTAHTLHEAGGWFLLSLIGLHTAAALFHQLVLRDGVFQSMWPSGRRRS
ncbi:MAG: cytochrome b/b6 domain-containing protein [Pseudomonadota bacterium]|nr:cytochrome b/b6 domain-containing protein [Pseudomonadota bacterium]